MSLAIETEYQEDDRGPIAEIPLGRLRPGEGVRSGGLDEGHVAVLMETCEEWPPIVIWGKDCTVLDGAHRVRAAQRLGLATIAAVRFLGTHEEAFVESVRRNIDHGLPLTVADRRRAALRVMARHGEWSDRRIGSLCGLSGKTVARLRRDELTSGEGVVIGLDRRVGRDGKARPVRAVEIRNRIRKALEEHPGGSLRFIGAMVGASPETVRTVRARLAEEDRKAGGAAPLAGGDRTSPATVTPLPSAVSGPLSPPFPEDEDASLNDWTSDLALLGHEGGSDFARWFADSHIGEEWQRYVRNIPLGRVYEVVDEARRRASAWTAFARILESRAR